MFAAGAVDFMRRERRGAAVQRGGKNRDRYLLTWQDFNKGTRNVLFPPLAAFYLLLFRVNIVFRTNTVIVPTATTGSL